MKNKKKILYIILSVILGSVAISLVDGVIRPEYVFKCVSKISVFPVLFALYFVIFKNERTHLGEMFRPRGKALAVAALLGAGVFAVVMGAYLLLRGVVDFSGFTDNLMSTAGLDPKNFIFVSLYICVINSLMEELFFRGLGFLMLKGSFGRARAYIFSSALFALYHTGMTALWFAPWQFLLMLAGLFIGGCIFDYVDEKTGSLFPSWLCHLFANLATCAIGFILLING